MPSIIGKLVSRMSRQMQRWQIIQTNMTISVIKMKETRQLNLTPELNFGLGAGKKLFQMNLSV